MFIRLIHCVNVDFDRDLMQFKIIEVLLIFYFVIKIIGYGLRLSLYTELFQKPFSKEVFELKKSYLI